MTCFLKREICYKMCIIEYVCYMTEAKTRPDVSSSYSELSNCSQKNNVDL